MPRVDERHDRPRLLAGLTFDVRRAGHLSCRCVVAATKTIVRLTVENWSSIARIAGYTRPLVATALIEQRLELLFGVGQKVCRRSRMRPDI
jgi:hypothetical protein